MPGPMALGLAVALGASVATGTLGTLAARTGPSHHGAPRIIQDHVPGLPGDRYAPNVCHPNDEPPASRAQLDVWITRAGQLLHRPYSPDERRTVLVVIDGESGGRVHAINCWDSNYDEHHPTMGLMQDRDDTYLAHAPKGCRLLILIYDGPCNIASSTDYAIGRYGSLAAIPGVGEVAAGGDYHTGY